MPDEEKLRHLQRQQQEFRDFVHCGEPISLQDAYIVQLLEDTTCPKCIRAFWQHFG